MSRSLLLGVDGGGTSTVAWLADAEGNVLGRGRAGASNIKAVGANAAMEALDLSILEALTGAGLERGPVEVACLGLAGFDRPDDRQWLRDWAGETTLARRLILVNDADLVLAAGTSEGHGIALIAGTGSIAIGKAADGRSLRVGGWGHLLGDEGSGYRVVLDALRLLARRADGRDTVAEGGPPDPLETRVNAALGIAGPSELVSAVYRPGFDRTKIASMAPAVVAAAEDGSALARAILERAGAELGEMALTVAGRLGWDRARPLPLALAGGFLNSSPTTRGVLLAELGRAGYTPEARSVAEPVEGAVALARRALDA